jgi:hypothetical protein
MKLADTFDDPPQDPFKIEYTEQNKRKYEVTGKVQEQNHWKNNDRSTNFEFKKGWKANTKWSQEENNMKC